MIQYPVYITKPAENDLDAIYAYIAEELCEPQTAWEQYNRLMAGILRLDVFPERAPLVSFEPERSMGIRRLNIDKYAVLFQLASDRVNILRVLYGPSDIPQRLHNG